MKRSGETRRGSRCEPESVDPARSHQHWYQINSQTLKLIDLLLRHWWTWWSECCRWRGGFKVSHKPHKTTCFDQGKRGSFRGTPSSTRRRSAYADPQSSVILNPRLLQNNHHYIYLPDKWQQNAESFTTRVHEQTQSAQNIQISAIHNALKYFFVYTIKHHIEVKMHIKNAPLTMSLCNKIWSLWQIFTSHSVLCWSPLCSCHWVEIAVNITISLDND